MVKRKLIKSIEKILSNKKSFWIRDLDDDPSGVVVGELGKFVGVAEYFCSSFAQVNVYKRSRFTNDLMADDLDSYPVRYEDMSEDILRKMLNLCMKYWRQEHSSNSTTIS